MTSDAPKDETFTFHHPELGPMTGLLTSDNVVQFKSVPFASIPGRFKQSVLLDSLPSDSSRDFTKLSYAAPQTFPDELAGGGPFPNDPSPHPTHEFSCLNLQINVPLACLTSSPKLANLPLLIYIHGGGFVLGKIDAQHNTAHLCSQALLSQQPLITAAIQYRLGALGYLYTASAAGEHENRALGDQRNALLWLQKFVRGFGGDAQRTTVFGESAGAISIACHMLSKVPETGRLFGRTVLMSGVLGPMVVPVSRDEAQERYEEFLGVLEIEERGERALERLREVEVDRIVEATAVLNERGAMWLPVRDEGFFVDEVVGMTWERFPEAMSACEWVDEIVLGTTGFEGTTQMSRVASISPREFLDGISARMGDESAELIGKAYDITSTTDRNLFITQAMRWMGDVIFDAPTHEVARHFSTKSNKKIYRYIFDVRNPFPNHAFYQQAHHWVDVYFVFKAHQFRYSSQRLKDISTKHAQLWIDFANGKAPWKEYKYTGNGDEVIMVADEREGWVEKTVAENEKIMEWSWKRCEALWESWKGESGKPFLPLKIVPLDGKKLT